MATELRQIQLRHGTFDQWTSSNPVLLAGEMGVVLDTGRWKIGDGATKWLDLPDPEQGPSLEFDWQGTSLGIRVEGNPTFTYVDLKGAQGIPGSPGPGLEFVWVDTALGVREEGQVDYVFTDLQGPVGDVELHAAQHAEGGTDPVTPAAIGAATDDHAHGQYLETDGGQLVSYSETVATPANTTGTVTLDLGAASVFRLTPTGACTIALTGVVAGAFQSFTLILATSAHALTWPAGTRFPGGEPPALDGETWLSGVVNENGVLTIGAAWSAVGV